MHRLVPALTLVAMMLGGCTTQHQLVVPNSTSGKGRPDLTRHVIAFDRSGNAVLPDGNGNWSNLLPLADEADSNTDATTFEDYVGNVLAVADSTCNEHLDATGGARRILIHVHGGLTHASDTAATTRLIVSRMEQQLASDPTDWHYPILVSWPSDALGAYQQHLFEIRQGRMSSSWALPTSPFFLVADLLRGFSRIITRVFFQIGNDLQLGLHLLNLGTEIQPSWRNARRLYGAALLQHDGKPLYNIYKGGYHPAGLRHLVRFFWYVVTALPKIVTQTLFLDGMGQRSWDVMLYRANSLFHRPVEFDVTTLKEMDAPQLEKVLTRPATGGMPIFLDQLMDHVRDEQARGARYEITLVGHSMGSIVLNKALKHIESRPESAAVTSIVYMAPACSIEEARDSVVPFLAAHEKTRFYVLVLNPVAEAAERNMGGLVQRGSLLEWIDNWWTTPASHADLRLGKWVNVVQALHLFKDVREEGRFTVKAFRVERTLDSMPQNHGEFNLCPFWRQSFWGIHEDFFELDRAALARGEVEDPNPLYLPILLDGVTVGEGEEEIEALR